MQNFLHRGRQRDSGDVFNPSALKLWTHGQVGDVDFHLKLKMREAVTHNSCALLPLRAERRLEQRFLR